MQNYLHKTSVRVLIVKKIVNFVQMSIFALILSPLVAGSLFFHAMSPESAGMNVESVCQDHQGNIWFGGRDGITLFDGSRFTMFRHRTEDVNSIPDNHVYKIFCDIDGRIWAAHLAGLSVYDGSDSGFRNYASPGGALTDLVQLSRNGFLLIAGSRLWYFDAERGHFVRDGIPALLLELQAHTLHAHGNTLYIGCRDGKLFSVSKELDRIQEIPAGIPAVQINCILQDSPAHLWAGTEGEGLWEIPLSAESPRQYKSSWREGSLSYNYVRNLALDDEGALWVGTKNGLNILREDGRFEVYYHNYYDRRSLSHNSVLDIFRDRQGTMWLGTYFGGACYCTPHSSQFAGTVSRPGEDYLNGNVMSDIAQAPDGSLWIGTNTGVLNHLLPDGRFRHLGSVGDSDPLDIKSIYISPSSGRIFIGADLGLLSELDQRSGKLKPLPGGHTDVYDMESNARGGFYFGSSKGLFEYDERSGTASPVPNQAGLSQIRSLKMDSRGGLWVGMKYGVALLERSSGRWIDLPESLSQVMYVDDILEDSAGRIWICSNDGLYRYEREDGSVRTYNTQHGLPDNVVHGAEEDSLGRLWLSTNNGLCRLDPVSGETRVFTDADGLPGNRFSSYAHCRLRSGEMCFGGMSWLVRFRPEDVHPSGKAVMPVVSSLEVNGGRRMYGGGDIHLKPRERDLAILFTAPDYISMRGGQFHYKLEGLDNQWHRAGTERKAVYHGLEKGKYTFLLSYRNSAGITCPENLVIQIRVAPYWWETLAARVIGILLLLAIAAGIVLHLLSKQKQRHRSELERVKNELLNEFAMEFVTVGSEKTSARENRDRKVFSKNDEEFMRRALEVVKRNLENPDFSVELFATEMFMSRSNLHLRVKALYGVSPLEFIKTVRLNEACRLLLEKKLPVADISSRVGFATPSYFAAVFRRTLGCTPTEYVRRNAR